MKNTILCPNCKTIQVEGTICRLCGCPVKKGYVPPVDNVALYFGQDRALKAAHQLLKRADPFYRGALFDEWISEECGGR